MIFRNIELIFDLKNQKVLHDSSYLILLGSSSLCIILLNFSCIIENFSTITILMNTSEFSLLFPLVLWSLYNVRMDLFNFRLFRAKAYFKQWLYDQNSSFRRFIKQSRCFDPWWYKHGSRGAGFISIFQWHLLATKTHKAESYTRQTQYFLQVSYEN